FQRVIAAGPRDLSTPTAVNASRDRAPEPPATVQATAFPLTLRQSLARAATQPEDQEAITRRLHHQHETAADERGYSR
ncbi:MAG TPA: hypothetical protein DGG94_07405, partial [Micromonosporaceae bacterium]|nr:hypothetical protein [Micromonosporaceae bacterium]